MPNSDKSFTDLFIPVHRSRSRASSIETSSTRNPTESSTLVTSSSTSPTTDIFSNKPSNPVPNSPPSSFTPSTGVRYTISSQSYGPRLFVPVIEQEAKPQPESAGNEYITKRSHRHSSSTSAVRDLALKFSHVLRSGDKRKSSLTSETPLRPSTLRPGFASPHARVVRNVAPTPFSSPEDAPTRNLASRVPRDQIEEPDPVLSTPTKSLPQSFEWQTEVQASVATTGPRSRRTISISSGRPSSQDRSCPPPSFPPKFYFKYPATTEAEAALAKNTLSPRPPRMQQSGRNPNAESPTKQLRAEGVSRLTASSARSSSTSPTRRAASINSIARSQSLNSQSNTRPSFHGTTHFYSDCVHTSPPTTRPLNVQPEILPSIDPSVPTRSTIRGRCFQCDTQHRRNAETRVLMSYDAEIERLVTELRALVVKLEEMSPLLLLNPHSGIEGDDKNGTEHLPRSPDDDQSDRLENVALENEIRALEKRVDNITSTRNLEVKAVWSGYTLRWGPATLGIVRGDGGDSSEKASLMSRSNSTKESFEGSKQHRRSGSKESRRSANSNWSHISKTASIDYGETTPEGRMRVHWIRD